MQHELSKARIFFQTLTELDQCASPNVHMLMDGENGSFIRGTNHDPDRVHEKPNGTMQQPIFNAICQNHLYHHTS